MKMLHHALATLLCAVLVAPLQAQTWPDRPVRIVIPFPTGGGADAAARLVAGQFTKVFGQSFVVESRPGGNTTIAASAVARAPADGYTLLMTGGSTMSVLPLVTEKLPFDAAADFVPVGMVSRSHYVLAASSQFGAGTLAEVLARARAGAELR